MFQLRDNSGRPAVHLLPTGHQPSGPGETPEGDRQQVSQPGDQGHLRQRDGAALPGAGAV